MFTTESIALLPKPAKGRRTKDYWEGGGSRSVFGFVVVVYASGSRSFNFIYHFNGRKRRMTLGKFPQCSLARARRLHFAAQCVLEAGDDPAAYKSNIFGEFIDRWELRFQSSDLVPKMVQCDEASKLPDLIHNIRLSGGKHIHCIELVGPLVK